MIHHLSELRGARLIALDGAAGRLRDLQIDGATWSVRRMLFEPDRDAIRQGARGFHVPAACLAASEETPVRLSVRLRLADLGMYTGLVDFQCLSALVVARYAVQYADGPMGRIEDLAVDDVDWSIAGLAISAPHGQRISMPPRAVVLVDHVKRLVRLRVPRSHMRSLAPAHSAI